MAPDLENFSTLRKVIQVKQVEHVKQDEQVEQVGQSCHCILCECFVCQTMVVFSILSINNLPG